MSLRNLNKNFPEFQIARREMKGRSHSGCKVTYSGRAVQVLFSPFPSLKTCNAHARLAAADVGAGAFVAMHEAVEIERFARHYQRATECVARRQPRSLRRNHPPSPLSEILYLAYPRRRPHKPDALPPLHIPLGAYDAGPDIPALDLRRVSLDEIAVIPPSAISREHIKSAPARSDRFFQISPQAFQRGGAHQFSRPAEYVVGKRLELQRSRYGPAVCLLHTTAEILQKAG